MLLEYKTGWIKPSGYYYYIIVSACLLPLHHEPWFKKWGHSYSGLKWGWIPPWSFVSSIFGELCLCLWEPIDLKTQDGSGRGDDGNLLLPLRVCISCSNMLYFPARKQFLIPHSTVKFLPLQKKNHILFFQCFNYPIWSCGMLWPTE